MSQIQYHIKFPVTQVLFEKTELTFSINKIRSRKPSVLYFILHCFDMDKDEVKVDDDGVIVPKTSPDYQTANPVYTSNRWVIGQVYEHRHTTFNITDEVREETAYTQLEIVAMGVDSENPLYFTEVMFQEGEFDHYHKPSEEIQSYLITPHNNLYANLYKDDGNYLQVIRPNREGFKTDSLTGAEVTILAPHFESDEGFDDDVAVFIEAMNQREQTINVLR